MAQFVLVLNKGDYMHTAKLTAEQQTGLRLIEELILDNCLSETEAQQVRDFAQWILTK